MKVWYSASPRRDALWPANCTPSSGRTAGEGAMANTADHAWGGAVFGRTGSSTVSLFRVLLWVQGVYYFVTGVWPLVSIETFLMVTGPKTDHLLSPNPTEADHWLV